MDHPKCYKRMPPNTVLFCCWCNDTNNVRQHFSVPDQWGHYRFCADKQCADYYDAYIYKNDLSHGLPFYMTALVKTPISTPKQCIFCGCIQLNVVEFPFPAPHRKRDNIFCKNNSCFRDYRKFITTYSTDEKFIAIIPYVMREDICKKIQTSVQVHSEIQYDG